MVYRLLLVSWILISPFFSAPVWSYVGPGVGITMLGTFWIVVSFIGMLMAGVLVWPIRSFFQRRKEKNKQTDTTDPS